jgi:hypothetical protein
MFSDITPILLFSDYRKINVVIWTIYGKKNLIYYINKDTTIQDIINRLKLDNVLMAFLGGDRPFELLPCDANKHMTKKEELFPGYIFPDQEQCSANDFSTNVVDLILSLPDVIIDISELRNENKDKIMTIQEIKEILCEELEFEEYSIHLFMYNHLQNDLRYSEGSKWSKKDWKFTTNESSLWLQLEKEYLTNNPNCDFNNWILATIPPSTI